MEQHALACVVEGALAKEIVKKEARVCRECGTRHEAGHRAEPCVYSSKEHTER